MDHNPLEELPIDIGNLKNLKVLDVSSTKLKKLPQNIVKLNNMETIRFDRVVEDNLFLCHTNWIYNIKKSNNE
jgi:Leucine-rich repeat (LRR) protein